MIGASMTLYTEGEKYLYYIVEHPTRGTLRDLEETNSGNIGRFSLEGRRNDSDRAMQFRTVNEAIRAMARITPPIRQRGCQIRRSQWNGRGFTDAWPVVS